MPDPEKIIKVIETIVNWIFRGQPPPWLFPTFGYILLLALALLAIWGLLLVLSKIIGLIVEQFWPLFYNKERKRSSLRRRRFADHIESEIRRLNNLEVWHDYRFTELEAEVEVEAEGKRRVLSILPFRRRTRSGLRRERSLSKALESSQERLILLEGAPGSGKSIALRHVAQSMARRAMTARSISSVVPIYVNLKELERRAGQAIDRNLIYTFVLKSLNRANDRDIEEFLDEEFDRGLREGTWLFLLDSFDEIPELLSSTETNTMIRNYADSISDFLHGMNQCRGIVASRQFRGPGQLGWPRFRILPLSEKRRLELVAKADLDSELEREIVGQLDLASHGIRSMASNPMFLGLLCEYMRSGNPFPASGHSVFENYIETRFVRDQERLWRRFGLKPADVRAAAECLAFSMAADVGLGLSPPRQNLESATVRLGLELGERFDALLDALEYIKLARSETATAPGESKPFTFAHRRFQEYFATCVVLREPDRVSPRQLLTDARWRETAVVMCQTQPTELLASFIGEARRFLTEAVDGVSGLIDNPIEYVREPISEGPVDKDEEKPLPQAFPWPSGVLHILGILQDGFNGRLGALPDDIRMLAGRLILSANSTGTQSDKKWGLEVAGIVPQPILLWLLRDAFATQSQWLKEVAYRQVARLSTIPDDIAASIRRAIRELLASRRLARERHTTRAHLARLDKSAHFVSVMRLLVWIPFLDLSLRVVLFLFLLEEYARAGQPTLRESAFLTFVLIVLCALHLQLRQSGGSVMDKLAIRAAMLLFVGLSDPRRTVLFVVFYVVCWTPFALLCAKLGQHTHPLFWPLMPLTPLFLAAKNAGKLRAVLNWYREAGLLLALGITLGLFLVVVAAGGALFGMILLFYVFLGTVKWSIYLLGGISGYLVLAVVALSLYDWTRDWFRWRGWLRSQGDSMKSLQFLEFIGEYRTKAFRVRFARAVREQGLLVPTDETTTMLKNLALVVERDKRVLAVEKARKKRKQITGDDAVDFREQVLSNLSPSESFDHWYNEYGRAKGHRLGKWESEVLDEISRLLDQTCARQRGR